MGSKKIILMKGGVYVPERWGRKSLCGTQEWDAITAHSIKCTTFIPRSKFRRHATDRFYQKQIMYLIKSRSEKDLPEYWDGESLRRT